MSISADKSKRVLEFAPANKMVIEKKWMIAVAAIIAAVTVVFIISAAYLFVQWKSFRRVTEYQMDSKLNDSKNYLGSNIKGFEERLQNLEKIMEPFSLLNPQNTLDQVIKKTYSDLEDRNEERFHKVEQKIDSMTEEVIKAREKVESANRKELLFISLINLRQKIDAAQPFKDELQLVSLAAGNDQAMQDNINILRNTAEKGVTSIIELRDQFSKIAGSLVQQQKEESAEELPFYKRFFANIYKGVHIRKIKNVKGNGGDAIVARVEDYLKKGNISLALEEIAKLDIKDNDQLDSWLAKAKSYQEADAAFSHIVNKITDISAQKMMMENQDKPVEVREIR